jgi:P pilus assembly chaperone PapD
MKIRSLAVGMLVALGIVPVAEAQLGISISPSRVELLTGPGRTVRETVTLVNRSSVALQVRLEMTDFDVDTADSVIEAPSGTRPESLAAYLKVTPSTASVPGGGSSVFRFLVHAPEQFTQLREMVFFRSTPVVGEAGGPRVVIVPRLGVPVYLENRKATPGHLAVKKLEIRRDGQTGDHIVLDLEVANQGERNFRPTGTLDVRSADGSFRKLYQLNEAREPVLPGKLRVWSLRFGPVPGGELSLHVRLATSFKRSYTAQRTLAAASSSSSS